MTSEQAVTPGDSYLSGYSERKPWNIKGLVGNLLFLIGMVIAAWMLVNPVEITLTSAQAHWLRSNGKYVAGAGMVFMVLCLSYAAVLIQESLRERKRRVR
jgi:hypothetical protein